MSMPLWLKHQMTCDPLLTEDEAAKELRVSRGTILRERMEGRIGYLRIRRRVFYRLSDIELYKAHQACPATASRSDPAHPIGTSSEPKDSGLAAARRGREAAKRLT